MAAPYEDVQIVNTEGLGVVHREVKSHHEIGLLVRRLSVRIKLCSCWSSEGGARYLCRGLFEVLEKTTNLQFLSLDLQECTKCFKNTGPQDFDANGKGANSGYDPFYNPVANRIRKESEVEPIHRRFLPKVEEFHFTSTDTHYAHRAFFELPSLKRIVSTRDTGLWPMILDAAPEIGTPYTHIRELTLQHSAILPSDMDAIRKYFPNLETFRVRNDVSEISRRYLPKDLADPSFWTCNFSDVLAGMRNLRRLELDLHYPLHAQINFPRHLGPDGGITGLRQLPHLTDLRIGMNLLMGYRVRNGLRAEPLLSDVLPRTLVRLHLYTCLSCWDNRLLRLSRGTPWQDTRPSCAGESTIAFVQSLVYHVIDLNWLPSLRDVRLYSSVEWWLTFGVNYRDVKHCPEERGQRWNAGGLDEFCRISLLENRIPGIHFRAYQTGAHDC